MLESTWFFVHRVVFPRGAGVHPGQPSAAVDPPPPRQPPDGEDLPLSEPTRVNIVLKRPARWTWNYRRKISGVFPLPEYNTGLGREAFGAKHHWN